VLVEHCGADVGPEFLENVEDTIQSHLGNPFLASFDPGAFRRRIVKIRNTC
jgi:hypothetical protein